MLQRDGSSRYFSKLLDQRLKAEQTDANCAFLGMLIKFLSVNAAHTANWEQTCIF